MAKHKLYMRVSNDKYELPEIIANSWTELAQLCGCSVNTIHSRRCHFRDGRSPFVRYVEVEFDDEDDDEV